MNTTISISEEIRSELKEFGNKGETYEDILRKLLKSAKERQLQELLMDDRNCIPIQDAIEEAKKRWRK